jgi:hypothetical protein
MPLGPRSPALQFCRLFMVIFRRTIHSRTLSTVPFAAPAELPILIRFTRQTMTSGAGNPVYTARDMSKAVDRTGTVGVPSLALILCDFLDLKFGGRSRWPRAFLPAWLRGRQNRCGSAM